MSRTVNLELTPEQYDVVTQALDVYMRLGLGQMEIVSELARENFIPKHTEYQAPKQNLTLDDADAVNEMMMSLKEIIGFSSTGCYGIFNPKVSVRARVAYELKSSLKKLNNPLATLVELKRQQR